MMLEILADIGGYIRSRECHTNIPMKLYTCQPKLFDDDSDEETDVPRRISKLDLIYGVRTRDGGILSVRTRNDGIPCKEKRRTNNVDEDDMKKH